MATDHPLFIYRYMDRTQVHKDSLRFRNRVAAAFGYGKLQDEIAGDIKLKAGLKVPISYGYDWDSFWQKSPMPDVLTSVTVAIRYSKAKGYPWGESFRKAVETAMLDENLGFKIDQEGIVHFAIDADFTHVHIATLVGLNDTRLSDARAAYEASYKYMDGQPPNTLQAVRRAFEAVEIVSRQLAPNHKNLHVKLCKDELKATCVPVLTADGVERRVLEAMFDSMGAWVDGMHFYRHGQPESDPPTIDTAVFVLTTASAHLRLLARVAVQILPMA
jgi:hypothetical protein